MNIKLNQTKSVTLIEVIIAMVAFSVIILYFTAIENISRKDLMAADRRAKVQNEAAYLMEHITKNIIGTSASGGAIGNTSIAAEIPVDTSQISGSNALKIWVDLNKDGRKNASPTDKQIAYSYDAANYRVLFYSDYPTSGSVAITSKRIRPNFSSTTTNPTYVVYTGGGSNDLNYLDIQITACWDPTQADGTSTACGTSQNPQAVVHARIQMPAVATH